MARSTSCAIALVVFVICGLPVLVNAQVNVHSVELRGQTGDMTDVVVSGTISGGDFTFSTLGAEGRGEFVIIPKANSPVALLANKTVHAELGIVDAQLDEMNRIQASHARNLGELTFFDFGSDVSGQIIDFAKQFDQIEDEYQSELQSVLLPHQVQRMTEVSLQMSLDQKAQGPEVGDAIGRALGMNDEERQRFRKRAIEIEKEASRKIELIKAEAREQLLDELTIEQRQKLELSKGEFFERFRSNPPARQVQKFTGSDNKK